MYTIGESISRVRGIMKATNEDAFLTDRFVYSIISKYAKVVLKRQNDQKKLMQHDELFEMLPFEQTIEVNKIEANCAPIKSNCTIRRTAKKLPSVFNGSKGPLIRKVYSIDSSEAFEKIKRTTYIANKNKSCTKYDNTCYYWYANGHLYFPDCEVEGIMIEALWEDNLDGYCTLNDDDCKSMQERPLPLPDYLFAEVEQMAEQEFGIPVRLPDNGADDGQNIIR